MTLKEIIYQIQNLRSGGIQSANTEISDEQMSDIVNYYRAKLIRQEIDRGMKLDPMLIQPIFDLKVERVKFDRNEPLSGKSVFRTIDKIPRAIATKNSNLVTFVGHNLLGKAFQRTSQYKAHLDVYRAYTGESIKWFEFDERIYVITEDGLQDIVVQLVAENPYKVRKLNKQVNSFDPFEYEYPVSVTILDSIFKLMLDTELKIGATPTDDLNDGLAEPTPYNNK